MSVIFHSFVGNHFGFFSADKSGQRTSLESEFRQRGTSISEWNLSVIASWIPIVGGIWAGVKHIAMGLGDKDADKDYIYLTRGVMAIMGFGLFLFLVDLIVTIGRTVTAPQTA